IYLLDLSDNEWTEFKPVSDDETYPTLPAVGLLDSRRNRLLFYGCFLNSTWSRELNFYSFGLDSHEWQTMECPGLQPTEVILSAFTYLPSIDRGFLYGGMSDIGPSSKLYSLDPETLLFTRVLASGAMSEARFAPSLAPDEDLKKITIFAGRTQVNFSPNVYYLDSFDTETNEWTELNDVVTGIPPSPRSAAAVVTLPPGTFDEYAYMLTFGGTGSSGTLNDLRCLRMYDYTADGTPPAKVSDLGVELNPQKTHVRLTWTAPGDDGMLGRAKGYYIRTSSSKVNDDADFEQALTVPVLYFPSFPGTVENFLLALPQGGQVWYFAIKTFDDAGNVSAMSNCASTAQPTIMPDRSFIQRDPRIPHRQENQPDLKLETLR
ncbi:MAG: hypothetical protein JW941_11545, partial [Candidatus Coatesbacteria bacterium]|nr:hypothetical protein [Candidatus Coatesbacteria bacterium]